MKRLRILLPILAAAYLVFATVHHYQNRPVKHEGEPFRGSVQWSNYRWYDDAPVVLTVDTRKLNSEWFSATEYATDLWEERTDGVVDFRLVTDKWADEHTADIAMQNGNFGKVKWVGLAQPSIDEHGHFTHVWISYNDYYEGNTSRRNVACHELGHAMGLGHAKGISSCMLPVSDDNETPYDTDVNVLEKIYGRLAER